MDNTTRPPAQDDNPELFNAVGSINENLDILESRIAQIENRLAPLRLSTPRPERLPAPHPERAFIRNDAPAFSLLSEANARIASLAYRLYELNDVTVI